MCNSVVVQYTSSRGFVTYTGRFQGVLVSIVVTLMGYPNMDFVIREVGRSVTGPCLFNTVTGRVTVWFIS